MAFEAFFIFFFFGEMGGPAGCCTNQKWDAISKRKE